MAIVSGLMGRAEITVTQQDTARTLGSGEVDVLGTPRVVALCEQAAVAAVADHLGPAETTVGARIALDHLAPTPVGSSVEATATLERFEGRTLEFSVQATDHSGQVATGLHVRVVVTRESFDAAAATRGRSGPSRG